MTFSIILSTFPCLRCLIQMLSGYVEPIFSQQSRETPGLPHWDLPTSSHHCSWKGGPHLHTGILPTPGDSNFVQMKYYLEWAEPLYLPLSTGMVAQVAPPSSLYLNLTEAKTIKHLKTTVSVGKVYLLGGTVALYHINSQTRKTLRGTRFPYQHLKKPSLLTQPLYNYRVFVINSNILTQLN